MDITQIDIFPFDTKDIGGNTLALADITFDDALKIKSLKLIESKTGGIFVTYPSQRGRDSKFYDIVIIKDKMLKQKIRDRILEEYKKLI